MAREPALPAAKWKAVDIRGAGSAPKTFPLSTWQVVVLALLCMAMAPFEEMRSSSGTSLLEQFRQRLSDVASNFSDDYLEKWLIARNYSLDQAEKMLRNSLDWRRVNHVDGILDTWKPPEVMEKYYSIGKVGFDKSGCPVWVTAQGRIDAKGIHASVVRRDVTRYLIWMMEKINNDLAEQSKQSGKKISKVTFIFDMDELSMRQVAYKPTMDTAREMVHMFEANYPEIMRKAYIINAPKLYTMVFNVLRPFMHQATINKINIFGHDKREWLPAMLEEIDASQLPVLYGGTLTDPDGDPNCPSMFNLGGEVPTSYYIVSNPPKVKSYMKAMQINAGSSKKIKFLVDVPGSIIQWEFVSEGGDIGFRVYCKSSDEDLVPLVRIESNLVAEDGHAVCEQVGEYVVKFDNSYSYFKSKKIHYHVAFSLPEPMGAN